MEGDEWFEGEATLEPEEEHRRERRSYWLRLTALTSLVACLLYGVKQLLVFL